MDNSVQTVTTSCPNCNHPFDRASHSDFDKKIRPEAGDLSVCIECGIYLIYLNSAGDLRLATDEDLDSCDEETLYQLFKVREAVKAVHDNKRDI